MCSNPFGIVFFNVVSRVECLGSLRAKRWCQESSVMIRKYPI